MTRLDHNSNNIIFLAPRSKDRKFKLSGEYYMKVSKLCFQFISLPAPPDSRLLLLQSLLVQCNIIHRARDYAEYISRALLTCPVQGYVGSGGG